MSSIRLIGLDPEFEVVVVPDPFPLSEAQRLEVDLLWEEEQARTGGALADGCLMCVESTDQNQLVARWVSRREHVAGQKQPALYRWRPPVPIGVVGCISCEGRLVLGRRPASADAGGGLWELVPWIRPAAPRADGGGTRFDFVTPLLARLSSDAAIPRKAIERATPFALAYEPYEPAWHVCVALDVRLDATGIRRLESACTPEHEAFALVRPVDVIEAGLWSGSQLEPLTAALVRLPAPDLRAA